VLCFNTHREAIRTIVPAVVKRPTVVHVNIHYGIQATASCEQKVEWKRSGVVWNGPNIPTYPIDLFHMMHLEHTHTHTQSESTAVLRSLRNIVFAHTDLLRSDYSTYQHHTAFIVS